MNNQLDIRKGYVLILTTVFIWGIDTILFKILLEDISPLLSVWIRYVIILITMQTIMVFKREEYKKEITDPNYTKLVICMGMTVVLYYVINMSGLAIATATVSDFIGTGLNSIAIILMLAIFIKHERRTLFNLWTLFALLIAIIGTFLASVGLGTFQIDKGALLIIISTLFWGLYTAFYSMLDHNTPIIRMNRDLNIVALFFLTILLVVTGTLNELFTLDLKALLFVISIALFVDVGTVLTYYKGIRLITGIRASILMLMSPVITYIIAGLFLKERLSLTENIGCALLFLSSMILVVGEFFSNKKDNKMQE